MKSSDNITSILKESRSFPPPKAFQSLAHMSSLDEYEKLWKHSIEEPEKFWADQAKSLLEWHKPFSTVLNWQPPRAQWFEDGMLNASYNCLDRHVLAGNRNKPALIWEGEPGETRTLSFGDLLEDVCKCANALKKMGISAGDRVTLYMPMIPELAIAVLACARVGAVHSVVFGGFSSEALADRNNDAQAKLIITADGGFRKGAPVPLKDNVHACLANSPTIEKVLVVRRTNTPVKMKKGRDFWWHDVVDRESRDFPPVPVPAEHPLFILYTSGSTGKPKGILHTTGGYLLGATLSSRIIFDQKENDVHWCTADIGWITGHSYVLYGPLSNGTTTLMYEGAPNCPTPGRFWEIIAKHKVTIFYTAPTAIRSFIKWGDQHVKPHDLSSLRLLGTVGEPINPEAWLWYRETIGGGQCPIVDTWWQTETGSIMISPIPGVTPTIPGTATRPFFGIDPKVVDKDGNQVKDNEGGFLVISKPWPSMLRTIYGDEERFRSTYWSQWPGLYFTGDGARKDEQGNFWILGRIDDVINVSGHRLSTMEIESSIASHPKVAEAAVVGRPHDVKGESIYSFVCLEEGQKGNDELKKTLEEHVVKQIGALARPDSIQFTEALPKTRSGKIMRRLLRDIAAGTETSGDTTTLEDMTVLNQLRQVEEHP